MAVVLRTVMDTSAPSPLKRSRPKSDPSVEEGAFLESWFATKQCTSVHEGTCTMIATVTKTGDWEERDKRQKKKWNG